MLEHMPETSKKASCELFGVILSKNLKTQLKRIRSLDVLKGVLVRQQLTIVQILLLDVKDIFPKNLENNFSLKMFLAAGTLYTQCFCLNQLLNNFRNLYLENYFFGAQTLKTLVMLVSNNLHLKIINYSSTFEKVIELSLMRQQVMQKNLIEELEVTVSSIRFDLFLKNFTNVVSGSLESKNG